jgi:hypothetical protein
MPISLKLVFVCDIGDVNSPAHQCLTVGLEVSPFPLLLQTINYFRSLKGILWRVMILTLPRHKNGKDLFTINDIYAEGKYANIPSIWQTTRSLLLEALNPTQIIWVQSGVKIDILRKV